jgi:hypothetical protein
MGMLPALISLLVGLLTLGDWRRGLLLVILVGVIQDVFRKLTLGAPAYFIIWVMAMYLFVAAIALLTRSLPPTRALGLNDFNVRAAWGIFLTMLFFQLINAYLRWDTPIVPIFGVLFYLGPPLAMLLGYGFATGERRLRQYLAFYVGVLVPACLTVYLSPGLQDSWPLLRDVGTFSGKGLIIYDVGTALKSYSGILRTGEISSWHAATAAIFLSVLAATSKWRNRRIIAGVLIALLIGVIVLTGRRKMLMALSIFFVAQWALMAWYRKGMVKLAAVVLITGTVVSFFLVLLEPQSPTSLYVQRSSTVYGDAVGRMELAFDLMKSAYSRSSGIGLGAGSAAQGGRHAGLDQSTLVGGSSESGLGMIMVELGVPGLLVALWLLFALGRAVARNLSGLAAWDSKLLLYQVSFIAFLFSNLLTFTVATQIYGDYFVLIVLGTVGGFVLRINNLVDARMARQRAIRKVMGVPRPLAGGRAD